MLIKEEPNLFLLDDLGIKYVIKRKDIKRLIIKYDSFGVLQISVPKRANKQIVESFIYNHLDWIKKHQPVNASKKSFIDGDLYLFLGKEYPLKIIVSKHSKVYLQDDILYCYVKDLVYLKEELDIFLKEQADIIFNIVLEKCFEKMNDYLKAYPKLVIKKAKSRWGCCYTKQNKIMLNLSLIHTPLELIEYVCYHELCHFLYPNHSPEFHNFLARFVGDEKILRKQLKKYQIEY